MLRCEIGSFFIPTGLYRPSIRHRSQILTAETLRIHPDEPEPALIDCVVSSLNSAHVVALPTDTFYGLAVDPVNLRAVDPIYDLKTRARPNPLSLLIATSSPSSD